MKKVLYATLPNGTEVYEYTVQKGDMELSAVDYGCIITHLKYRGKDRILGYDRLEDYMTANGSYQGAFIGRYANRISGGGFTLNGKRYTVANNETGRWHLHGGHVGFDKKCYDAAMTEDSITFTALSPDGEEGYPGNLELTVCYALRDDALVIDYAAKTDADTVVNVTNHSYFNLGGETIKEHVLTLNADAITPVDDLLIPTGEILDVTGTPFDFRMGKTVSEGICGDHPQIALCGGVDHNFILGKDGEMKVAATLEYAPAGIGMECSTTEPAVQIYTSNFLNEKHGRGGVALYQYMGICLETQHYPDTPNQPEFPTCTLRAGETMNSRTVYRFYPLG